MLHTHNLYKHTNIAELEILDANFGMLPRDLDVVKKMKANKEATGNNPKISYSGLAKNGSKWLPEIIDIIHNNLLYCFTGLIIKYNNCLIECPIYF